MKRFAVWPMLLLVASLLIVTSRAVPPDFFRNGRGGSLSKRTAAEFEQMAAICYFCGKAFKPEMEYKCRQEEGDTLRHCVMAYTGNLYNTILKRGWA